MAGRRILVCDDEPLFRSSIAESLRGRFEDVEVLEAEDGSVALAKLADRTVDVLITDIRMPNMGGFDLIAQISAQRMPVQVIVVSAHLNDKTRGELDELGALAWIEKPIDLRCLQEAVARMLAIPRAHVTGVTLAGFLQLVEMERQSCAVRVSSPQGTGTLVFEAGQLIDAWSGERTGDDAALSIMRFRQCTLDAVGVLQTTKPRTTQPLSFLLMEAVRIADEEGSSLSSQWKCLSVRPPRSSPGSSVPSPGTSKLPPNREELVVASALRVPGCTGAAVVALEDARLLAVAGVAHFDLTEAALANARLYYQEKNLLQVLNLSDRLEEMLISVAEGFHLMRGFAGGQTEHLLFLAIDRATGNLALARRQIQQLIQSHNTAVA